MSLKINGSIINTIKINGNEICLGKINGETIFNNQNTKTLTISINEKNIIVTGTKQGNYDLCYADDNGIIKDYEKIASLTFDGSNWTYSYFNDLNIAPSEATKIVLLSNNRTLGSVNLTDNFKFNTEEYGNKLYSVGLLSDIHIDGNGDGNNSDSGNSQSDFTNALQYFKNKAVDFICIDGDVTYYGYDADYTAYKSLISNYSIPIKAIRGNHECYVNGSDNYDYMNTKFQENVNELYYEYIYNNDVYLFCGMYQESTSTPFSNEELTWLSNKLEEHKNKRVFLFVHYYYGEVGNVNNIVSIHKPISNQTFINLITNYKNVIYFSGHTHLAFYHQEYGEYANIKSASDLCHRVHIPSCAKPRISSDGTEGSAQVYAEGSEGYLMDVYEKGIVLKGINFETNKFLPIANYYLDTPIEASKEETIHYTIAENWVDYNNSGADGTFTRDNLDAWVSASNNGDFKGLALDFTLTETHNLKATFEFSGYEGCPKYQVAYIIKDGSEWLHEFTMRFDDLGTNFTRTINQVLEAGSYQLVLGSWGAMDFGVKCTGVSLTDEIPQNLFDLSSYSFPTTKYGLTFNYDNTKKSLLINGYSNDDFGLYIPLSIPAGNYTFSYQPNQSELGFYFSIDEISASTLTGWAQNNKTFDVTSTTSQIILWFDAGYTYNNLELSFNLVKND